MKAIVAPDNVYFVEATTNHIGFASLYTEKYKNMQTNEIHFHSTSPSDKYMGELTSIELTELCNNIGRNVNADTLDWTSAMGRTLLTVEECDVMKIQKIIQSLLDQGYRIYVNDGSQLTLSHISNYCWETRERCILANYKKYKLTNHWNVIKNTISSEWKNADRVKLLELKEFMIMEFPEENDNCNSYWRTLFQEQSSSTPILDESVKQEDQNTKRERDKKQQDQANDDEGLCIICLENEAETYLESCEHIVVCEKCANQLAQHPNPEIRLKCIYCKQKISKIHHLKSMKIVDIADISHDKEIGEDASSQIDISSGSSYFDSDSD
jgi:hypothetical protein